MKIDLTALHKAVADHTVATQALLNANAAHVAAAAANSTSAADVAAAQTDVNTLAAEVASQTAAIVAFNAANPAPAA